MINLPVINLPMMNLPRIKQKQTLFYVSRLGYELNSDILRPTYHADFNQ